MREQRSLLFNKNAPSAIIQDKGKKKGMEVSMLPSPDPKSPTEHVPGGVRQRKYEGGAAGNVSLTDKQSPVKSKSSGGGWFKRKKKETSTEPIVGATSDGAAGGKVVTKKDSAKKTYLGRKTAENVEVKKEQGSKRSALSQKSTVGGESRGKDARRPKRGLVTKVTSIDDVDMEENVEMWEKSAHKAGEVTEHMKKTFSYEGNLLPSDTNKATADIPRSQSHNATFRSTLLQAVQQQQQQQQHNRSLQEGSSLEAPIIAHHHQRSKSYHEEEEGGAWGGGGDEGGTDSKLSVEARETSKSQSDVSRIKIEAKRVKKSGVVKDMSSWGQRPTLGVSATNKKDIKATLK